MATPEEILASPSNISRPVAKGYGARLDNTLLRVVNDQDNPIQIQYAEMQAPRVQTGEDPEDAGAPEFGFKFARSNFTGGEGLDFAHRIDNPANYRTRFWDSKGIDVFTPDPGERRELRLNKDVEEIFSSSKDNIPLARFDEKLFVGDGEDVQVIDSPSGSYSTSSEQVTSGTTVHDLVAYGGHLYAACGSDGIYRRDTDGNWSSWSNQPAYGVWSEKGRIFCVEDNVLYEAKENDDSETVASLGGGGTWNDVTDVGEAIAAAASPGEIWFFSITEDDTIDLIPASQVPLYNDIPVAISGYRGMLFYLTYQPVTGGYMARLWSGVFQQGNIADTAVIREWGTKADPLPEPPSALTPHHAKMYAGITEPTSTHLWKYDLETTGRIRDIGGDSYTGRIIDIESVGDTLFYSIKGEGVYRESDEYVSSGYLILPLVDFFDAQTKSWVSVDIDMGSLNGGGEAHVYYSTDPDAINDRDHGSWREVIHVENHPPEEPIRFRRVSSRYMTLKIVLDRGDNHTKSPSFRSVSMTAYPGETDLMLQVPINVSDRFERPGRRAVTIDNLGDITYRFLQSKHSRSVYFELYRPEERIMGTVIDVSERIPYVNKVTGSVTYISTLTVRGRRVGRLTQALSGELIGIQLIGISSFGEDEEEE